MRAITGERATVGGAIGAAAVALGLAAPAPAHVVTEAPWEPIAAAYLHAVFATALRPVDWDGINDRFEGRLIESQGEKTVYELLAPIAKTAGVDPGAAIKEAIKFKDAAGLKASGTRAMSQTVRYHLAEARARLDQPGIALAEIGRARGQYRAFERFIRAADPDSFVRLGLAWLDLATAAGERLGPRAAADPAHRFDEAAQTIVEFLIANYEAPNKDELGRRGPVPATGRGNDTAFRLAPWLPPEARITEQDELPRLMLNFEQRGQNEKDLFLVAYGDMLFDSPFIFGEPARSLGLACASCHNRGDVNRNFYIPGLSQHRGGVDVDGSYFNPRANDMRFDPVDIPSLRGIRFTAPYGRDGRIASLREFTRIVIVGEFAGPEPTPLMLDALIAYMNEFDFLPAPFLARDGRLNEAASDAAKRGEQLFNKPFPQMMGGMSCASCHVPSSNFVDGKRHDIGSGTPATKFARDSAFDTPTLLSSLYTAPYFHDGSLAALVDVVAWFDERFGLKLAAAEKADLTAYLEAAGAGEEPYQAFDEKNTRFRLDFEENATFLSTLDTLIPARDRFHADLLIRSVASDLRLDATTISDLRKTPMVLELVARLEALGAAIAAEKWDEALRLWDDYKELQERHGDDLY